MCVLLMSAVNDLPVYYKQFNYSYINRGLYNFTISAHIEFVHTQKITMHLSFHHHLWISEKNGNTEQEDSRSWQNSVILSFLNC